MTLIKLLLSFDMVANLLITYFMLYFRIEKLVKLLVKAYLIVKKFHFNIINNILILFLIVK